MHRHVGFKRFYGRGTIGNTIEKSLFESFKKPSRKVALNTVFELQIGSGGQGVTIVSFYAEPDRPR